MSFKTVEKIGNCEFCEGEAEFIYIRYIDYWLVGKLKWFYLCNECRIERRRKKR